MKDINSIKSLTGTKCHYCEWDMTDEQIYSGLVIKDRIFCSDQCLTEYCGHDQRNDSLGATSYDDIRG